MHKTQPNQTKPKQILIVYITILVKIKFSMTNISFIVFIYLWYTNTQHNRRKDKINSVKHTRADIVYARYTCKFH